MKMWVRTQNKEQMIEVDNLYIKQNAIWYDSTIALGFYKSKERAIEVLDDIKVIQSYKYMANLDFNAFLQTMIEKFKNIDERNKILMQMSTYQMPEK